MKRDIRYLKAHDAIRPGRLCTGEINQTLRSRLSTSNEASKRKILNLNRWRPNLEDSVDEMLSSALVVQDKELARILHEVDQVSRSLKSDGAAAHTISETLERTVLCAVRQSLLENCRKS